MTCSYDFLLIRNAQEKKNISFFPMLHFVCKKKDTNKLK